jgi:26S proteasome regulatory subunit N3
LTCCLCVTELKRNITLLETVVKTNAKEKIPRILRTTSKLRKTLSVAQLQQAVEQLLPSQSASKPALQALLAKIEAKAQAAADEARATAVKGQDVEMADASLEVEPAAAAPATVVLPVVDLIEVEIYLFLYVLAALMKYKLAQEALDTVDKVVARCQQFNRRTLDLFQAKVFTYYSNIHEQFGHDLPAIRKTLLDAHRTSCLRYDEAGQATLINLLLRNYLKDNLYEQAYKFVSKTTFPETVSNNQFVRYLYYVGKIQAVQLEYTESYTKLMQSIRKAPANTAFGFRRTVYKLAIIVQLLMGEVPERNVFNQDELRKALAPYLQLTNVRLLSVIDWLSLALLTNGGMTLLLRSGCPRGKSGRVQRGFVAAQCGLQG